MLRNVSCGLLFSYMLRTKHYTLQNFQMKLDTFARNNNSCAMSTAEKSCLIQLPGITEAKRNCHFNFIARCTNIPQVYNCCYMYFYFALYIYIKARIKNLYTYCKCYELLGFCWL